MSGVGQSHRSCKDFEDQSVVEFKGRVDFTKFSSVSLPAGSNEAKARACKVECQNDLECGMWSVSGATCRKFPTYGTDLTNKDNGLVVNPALMYNSGFPDSTYLTSTSETTVAACKARCRADPRCNFFEYSARDGSRTCKLNTCSSPFPRPTGYTRSCEGYTCLFGNQYIASDNSTVIKFDDDPVGTSIGISLWNRNGKCHNRVTGTIQKASNQITYTLFAVNYTIVPSVNNTITILGKVYTRNTGTYLSIPENICCTNTNLTDCVRNKEFINVSNGLTLKFVDPNFVTVSTNVSNLCFLGIPYTVDSGNRTINFNFLRNDNKRQDYVLKSITSNSFYMDRKIIDTNGTILNRADDTEERVFTDLYFIEKPSSVTASTCITGNVPANINYNSNHTHIGTTGTQLTLEGLQFQGTPDPEPTIVFAYGEDYLFMHTPSKGCRRFNYELISIPAFAIRFIEYSASVPYVSYSCENPTNTDSCTEIAYTENHISTYIIENFGFDVNGLVTSCSIKRIYERFNQDKTSKLSSVTSGSTTLNKITGFDTSVCLQCNSNQFKKCEYTEVNPVTQLCKDGTAPTCENKPPMYPFASEMIFVHREFFNTRVRFLPDGTCTTDNITFIKYRRFDKYIITENDDAYFYEEITFGANTLHTLYSYKSDVLYYNIENCLYKKTLISPINADGTTFHCFMFLGFGSVQYRQFNLGKITPIWSGNISIKMPGNYHYVPSEYGFSEVSDNDYFEQMSDADAPTVSAAGTYSVSKAGVVTISGFTTSPSNVANGSLKINDDYTFGTFYPYYKQLISGLNGYDRSPSTITNSWTTSWPIAVDSVFQAAYEADIRENVVGFEYDRSNGLVYFISFNDEPNIQTNIDDLVSPYSLKIQSTSMTGKDPSDEDYDIGEGLVAKEFYIYDTDLNESETFHCGFVDNVFKSQRIAPISQGATNQDKAENKSFVENLSTRIENNTSKPSGWWGGYTQEELDGFKSFGVKFPSSHNSNKIVYMRSSHPTRGNIFRGIHHKYRLPMHYRGVIGNICENPVNIPKYSITLNGISVTLPSSNPLKLYKVDEYLYVTRAPLLNRQDFEISVREEFGSSEDPSNYEHQSFLLNDFTTTGTVVDDCYWFRNGNILTSATNPNITFDIGTWDEPTLKDNVLEILILNKDECTYKLTDETDQTCKYIYTNNCLYILSNDGKLLRSLNFSGLDGELYDTMSGSLMDIVVDNRSTGHPLTWILQEDLRNTESLGTMVKNFLSSYLLNLVAPPHASGVDNVGVNFFYYFLLVGTILATAGGGVGGGGRAAATRIPATPIGSGRVPFPRDPKVGVKPPSAQPTQIPPTPIGSGRTYTGSFRGIQAVVPKGGAGKALQPAGQVITKSGGKLQTAQKGQTPDSALSRANSSSNGSFRQAADDGTPPAAPRQGDGGLPTGNINPGFTQMGVRTVPAQAERQGAWVQLPGGGWGPAPLA